MISFCIAFVILLLGYFVYGRFVEKIFGIDKNRITPAYSMQDGVDYVPMPLWKVFLIQFLNIAGLGPIFGAIMGVMFGPASFLWIVFGTIFAGAVHDFLSGMISIRMNGASLPEIIGSQLGGTIKNFTRVFALILMILVGAVFISGPSGLLAKLTPNTISVFWWSIIIFAYYLLATLMPIDKLIGRIYPVFGAALLFMAIGIFIALFVNGAPIPEITSGLQSRHPAGLPIFPMMFISIACGAISGFHATQSPLMARCVKNEKYGRPAFYGAMVAEGAVALIWAAAASSFFGSIEGLQNYAASLPETANKAAEIVSLIANDWLGVLGGFLAILGVIAAPITTGDTALRSARLITADFMNFNQKSIKNRLIISIPIFALTFSLLYINFDILWRYFAWCNQMLSVFTLWAVTVYLVRQKKPYWITIIPAIFMTYVCITYIVYAPEGFRLPLWIGVSTSTVISLILMILFFRWKTKFKNTI